MNTGKKYSGIFCFFLFLVGCEVPDARLEKVLQYSGANRKELEKVLNHYATRPADSLKRKAALFLIVNMPGHYTYEGDYLRTYMQKVDAIGNHPYPLKRLLYTLPFNDPLLREELTACEDIKTIRAEFLIHHIEGAFRQWRTLPWLRDIGFDTFCEYVLPYRMENEPLDYWRDSLGFYREDLDRLAGQYDEMNYSVDDIRNRFFSTYYTSWKTLIPEERLKRIQLDCIPLSKLNLNILRTIGLPSAIDYIPHFANHNGRHYWVTSIDPQTRAYESYHTNIYSIPKVYRRTYSRQPTAHPGKKEYVPPFFRDPFNKDITDLYLQTADVTLEVPSGTKARHAYLAVFNDHAWQPVAAGKIEGRKVCFPKMGKEVVYLPVYFTANEMHPLAAPFVLGADGRFREIHPCRDSLQTLRLVRKHPYPYNFYYWTREWLDARVEASDDPEFLVADTLAFIREQPDYRFVTLAVDTAVKKRYWRIATKTNWYGEIAELEFLDSYGKPVQGRMIGPDSFGCSLLEDKNPLTTKAVRWIGVDLGKPAGLSAVRFLPRSDANGIYPGNDYELFFYDYPRGWVSLGRRRAEDYSLSYEKVPAAGLYWLRNLTTGREERIFTWEEGRAHFW